MQVDVGRQVTFAGMSVVAQQSRVGEFVVVTSSARRRPLVHVLRASSIVNDRTTTSIPRPQTTDRRRWEHSCGSTGPSCILTYGPRDLWTAPYGHIFVSLLANFLDGILYTVRRSAVHKCDSTTHVCIPWRVRMNRMRGGPHSRTFAFVWRPRSILCLLGWIWQTIQASPRSYDQMSPLGGLPRCSTFRMRA